MHSIPPPFQSQWYGPDVFIEKKNSEYERSMETPNSSCDTDSLFEDEQTSQSMDKYPLISLQSVTKGRLALTKAQDHIRKFEEHLKIAEHGLSNTADSITSLPFLVHDAACIGDDDSFSIPTENFAASFDDTDFIVQQLVQAENSRAERDPQRALSESSSHSITRQCLKRNMCQHVQRPKSGDSLQMQKEQTLTLSSSSAKRTRSFHHPSKLQGTKRSMLKASRVMDEKNQTDDEVHKKHEFKALPLPDGTWVKNDPYALTSAAIGKRTHTNHSKTSCAASKVMDHGRPSTHRMDAATLLQKRGLNHSCIDDTDLNKTHIYSNAPSNSIKPSGLEHEQLEKMYHHLTRQVVVVVDDADADADVNNNQSTEDQHDAVALQQHLSKLQASLKLKHTQCIHFIEQIHQVDALNDHTMDETQNVSDLNPNAENDGTSIQLHPPPSHKTASNDDLTLNQVDDDDDDATSQLSDPSLYTRQRSWLQRVEARRMEAKQHREMNEIAAIQNFSISAFLKNTSKSWIMAKAAHQRAVSKAILKEQGTLESRQSGENWITAKRMQGLESLEDKLDLLLPKKRTIKKLDIDCQPTSANNGVIHDKISNADANSTTSNRQNGFGDTSLDATSSYSLYMLRQGQTHSQQNDTTSQMDLDGKEMSSTMNKTTHEKKSNVTLEGTKEQTNDQQNEMTLSSQKYLGEKKKPSTINETSQEKKFNILHLSVNEARKVLLQKIVKGQPPTFPSHIKMKEISPSPYSQHNLKINKKAVKKLNKANRFQSAAMQAKLYADILSRSMHLRQGRINNLVPVLNIADENKAATSAMTMKDTVTGNIKRECNYTIINQCESINKEEPFQRFEMGKAPFFDRSSSTDKGRFRVRDARYFAPDSIKRIAVPWDSRGTHGVMLLVGRKYVSSNDMSNLSSDEQVITVLFDRPEFSENDACRWWQLNRRHVVKDEPLHMEGK